MPKCKPLPPLEQLQAALAYDPKSPSGLRWRSHERGKGKNPHAGCLDTTSGYWRVGVAYRNLMAHRVVWALHHGEDPGGLEIDHADGDRRNNRVENLRVATRAQNMRNQSGDPGRSSWWCGVRWTKRGKWRSTIVVDGRQVHLGHFTSEESAARAYDRAAIKHHGEFARTNFPITDYNQEN